VLSAIRKAAVLGKAGGLDRKAAEKLLFNIGRIPLRQSTKAHLRVTNGKSCRRAEKVATAGTP
jgi:hypothetical protein